MIRLVMKNITRRPFRTGALILSFAFIAASLFAGYYLTAGASENMRSAISHLGADVIVVPGKDASQSFDMILRGTPAMFFFDNGTLDAIAKVAGVGQVAPRIYLVTLGAGCCSAPVQLIAIDPADSITRQWLIDTGQKPPGKDEIIVGSEVDGNPGSSLTFYGHVFTIAGRLEPTGTGTDVSVFLRTEDARTMAADSAENAAAPLVIPEGKVSAILVRVSNSTTDTVALAIPNRVPGTRVITPGQLITRVSDQLAPVTRMLDLAALFTILVSFPLITLVSVMATDECQSEFRTLLAQGASKGTALRRGNRGMYRGRNLVPHSRPLPGPALRHDPGHDCHAGSCPSPFGSPFYHTRDCRHRRRSLPLSRVHARNPDP